MFIIGLSKVRNIYRFNTPYGNIELFSPSFKHKTFRTTTTKKPHFKRIQQHNYKELKLHIRLEA